MANIKVFDIVTLILCIVDLIGFYLRTMLNCERGVWCA